MLKLQQITKTYDVGGDLKVQALRGIDLEFRKSEFVSILGPSGCGKTTLLNIIGGLDRNTTGDLFISGKSTAHYGDREWDNYRNHSIGFVFQSYNLIPHMDVLANVELAPTISGVSKAERRIRSVEALKKVGLGDQLHKKPNQLSGGQMQRVAIARALVNNPEILLADEPTASLDEDNSLKIAQTIANLRSDNRILIVATHEHCFDELADEIIDLRYGVIDSVQTFTRAKEEEISATRSSDGKKIKPVSTLAYNLKRERKQFRFLSTFPYALIFLVIMLVSTLQNCFYDEYFNFMRDKYPIDAFNLERIDYNSAPSSEYKDKIKVRTEYRSDHRLLQGHIHETSQDLCIPWLSHLFR